MCFSLGRAGNWGSKQRKAWAPVFLSWLAVGSSQPRGPAPRCSPGSCPYPVTKPGTACLTAEFFNNVIPSLLKTRSVLSQEYFTQLYKGKTFPFRKLRGDSCQENGLSLSRNSPSHFVSCEYVTGREVEYISAVVLKKNNSFLKELWRFWKARALTPFRAASSGKPEAAFVSVPSWLKDNLEGELLPLIWVKIYNKENHRIIETLKNFPHLQGIRHHTKTLGGLSHKSDIWG